MSVRGAGSLVLLAAASALAQPLPSGMMMALPTDSGIAAGWLIAPAPAAAEGPETRLAVDPEGKVWLTEGRRALFVPEENALIQTDRPVQQLFWLGPGLQLARSSSTLGRFVAEPAGERGLPRVRFKPLAEIPLSPWKAALAGPGSLYILGYNPRKQVTQLGISGAGAGEGALIKILFQSKLQIADVAGDGRETWFASGPAIWKLDAAGGAPKIFFAHPTSEIRQLVHVAGAGLFYATDEGVGFAGRQSQFDFLRRARCQIAAAGDDLYVLLGPLSGGIVRIRGASRFAKVR